MIHSTCRCQSGVTVEETVGGGANSEVVNVEYVRSIDRRMDKRAGRRSDFDVRDRPYFEAEKHTYTWICWIELISTQIGQRWDGFFDLHKQWLQSCMNLCRKLGIQTTYPQRHYNVHPRLSIPLVVFQAEKEATVEDRSGRRVYCAHFE